MTKLKKLLSLSFAEIVFRLREKGVEASEFFLHRLERDHMSEEDFLTRVCAIAGPDIVAQRRALANKFWDGSRPRFFTETLDRERRRPLLAAHPLMAKTIAEADRILSHGVCLLGHDWKLFETGWQDDPVTGRQWPDGFYATVYALVGEVPCDIKYVWEVNRHQYLIVLAKAFHLTGDEKYARPVAATIMSWIEANPFRRGVNWTSSLELAVRALSWLWAVFLCRGAACLTDEFISAMLKSLHEHGRQIERHLSVWSSPYNHLIGEVAALHLIGGLCPFFPEGRRWEETGWRIMADTVGRQFHPDGLTVEQATFYHHFTLGFYLQSALFLRHNGQEISPAVAERLERACECALYLTRPDGELPRFGDIDNARSLYFSSDHNWDFRGFLALGASLFNRPDFLRPLSGGIPEEPFWLLADAELAALLAMPAAEPEFASRAFSRSGYFVMRDSWRPDGDYLCFDCGEIADGLHATDIPSAAHGHADALAIELAAHGRPFIVDGGFCTYFGELAWHRHFREEEAHNTVLIEGHRQARYCGRLTWQRVRRSGPCRWKSEAMHDYAAGFIDLEGGVRHERQVLYLKGSFWLLVDRVTGCPPHAPVSSFLHFDPAVELAVAGSGLAAIATSGGNHLLIAPFGVACLDSAKGGERPDLGWIGEGYGFRRPGFRLRCPWRDGEGFAPRVVVTLLVPFADAAGLPRVGVSPGLTDGRWAAELIISSGPLWDIAVGADGRIRVESGDGAVVVAP